MVEFVELLDALAQLNCACIDAEEGRDVEYEDADDACSDGKGAILGHSLR